MYVKGAQVPLGRSARRLTISSGAGPNQTLTRTRPTTGAGPAQSTSRADRSEAMATMRLIMQCLRARTTLNFSYSLNVVAVAVRRQICLREPLSPLGNLALIATHIRNNNSAGAGGPERVRRLGPRLGPAASRAGQRAEGSSSASSESFERLLGPSESIGQARPSLASVSAAPRGRSSVVGCERARLKTNNKFSFPRWIFEFSSGGEVALLPLPELGPLMISFLALADATGHWAPALLALLGSGPRLFNSSALAN